LSIPHTQDINVTSERWRCPLATAQRLYLSATSCLNMMHGRCKSLEFGI
jgi:hypothetical protein